MQSGDLAHGDRRRARAERRDAVQELARRGQRPAWQAVQPQRLAGEVGEGHAAPVVDRRAAHLHVDRQARVRHRLVAERGQAMVHRPAQRHQPLARIAQPIAEPADGLMQRADGREVGQQHLDRLRARRVGRGQQGARRQAAQHLGGRCTAARELLVLVALRRRQQALGGPARVQLGQAALLARDDQQFAARDAARRQQHLGCSVAVRLGEELEQPSVEVGGAHGGDSCLAMSEAEATASMPAAAISHT